MDNGRIGPPSPLRGYGAAAVGRTRWFTEPKLANRSSQGQGQPAFAKATAGNLRLTWERRLVGASGFEPLTPAV